MAYLFRVSLVLMANWGKLWHRERQKEKCLTFFERYFWL